MKPLPDTRVSQLRSQEVAARRREDCQAIFLEAAAAGVVGPDYLKPFSAAWWRQHSWISGRLMGCWRTKCRDRFTGKVWWRQSQAKPDASALAQECVDMLEAPRWSRRYERVGWSLGRLSEFVSHEIGGGDDAVADAVLSVQRKASKRLKAAKGLAKMATPPDHYEIVDRWAPAFLDSKWLGWALTGEEWEHLSGLMLCHGKHIVPEGKFYQECKACLLLKVESWLARSMGPADMFVDRKIVLGHDKPSGGVNQWEMTAVYVDPATGEIFDRRRVAILSDDPQGDITDALRGEVEQLYGIGL